MRPAAGRLAADIIASKPQDLQAKELCSFALLNLTWNSIVKLLQLLADVPDQPRVTASELKRWCLQSVQTQALGWLMLSCHAGFHVSRLLQLLSSYVKQQFDIVLEDKLLNQVKVGRTSCGAHTKHGQEHNL